jgi:hypothetical protein
VSERSIFVCPNPIPWSETYKRLEASWRQSGCHGDGPPMPLILSGWWYSSDRDKQLRWEQTIQWAEQHNCRDLIRQIPETECYYTSHVSTSYPEQHYGPQVHPPAERPSDETVLAAMERLRAAWGSVAGAELADVCSPLEFTGHKRRRLLVAVTRDARPPWGDWYYIASDADRGSFTAFRRRINESITPLHVDHIDFTLRFQNA